MLEKIRCQSCGMPLGYFRGEENYGTNEDGSQSKEFCQFCFKDGRFTDSSLTLQKMLDRSTEHMMRELQFDEETSRELANRVIPRLKRWSK